MESEDKFCCKYFDLYCLVSYNILIWHSTATIAAVVTYHDLVVNIDVFYMYIVYKYIIWKIYLNINDYIITEIKLLEYFKININTVKQIIFGVLWNDYSFTAQGLHLGHAQII